MGFRGDSIVQFDWCVGELMKTVARLGLTENTLFVLCSDNGPVLDDGYQDGAVEKLGEHEPAGPFSGGKYSVYEGGTRTPFITRWPGTIPAGVSDQVVCTIDLPASLAALAEVSLPKGACADSVNVADALLGKAGAKARDFLVQQDNGVSGNFGLRAGDWKLVRMKTKGKSEAKVSKKERGTTSVGHALYFLPEDPGEEKDVSAQNTEKTQELIAKLDAIVGAK